jgi:hypothetical protein
MRLRRDERNTAPRRLNAIRRSTRKRKNRSTLGVADGRKTRLNGLNLGLKLL